MWDSYLDYKINGPDQYMSRSTTIERQLRVAITCELGSQIRKERTRWKDNSEKNKLEEEFEPNKQQKCLENAGENETRT